MTEERLPLAELLAKADDGDFLRSVAEAVVQLLMEADAEGIIGAVLLEASDEWQLQNRYMQTERMTELMTPAIDAVPTQIATMAA